jgi:hypothetical protein
VHAIIFGQTLKDMHVGQTLKDMHVGLTLKDIIARRAFTACNSISSLFSISTSIVSQVSIASLHRLEFVCTSEWRCCAAHGCIDMMRHLMRTIPSLEVFERDTIMQNCVISRAFSPLARSPAHGSIILAFTHVCARQMCTSSAARRAALS